MKYVGSGKRGALPYALGLASSSLTSVVIGQLTYALTSSAGMAAATVGLILMCSRFLDGISDLIAGFIIDRTHSKFGKARPYDLMAIPTWILVVLCFSVPGLSTVGKILWVLVTYNMCQTVCYTFLSVSITIRPKRSFLPEKRAGALAVGTLLTALMATVASVILPLLIQQFEAQPYGWTIISSCFAIPGIILSLVMFFFLPEMKMEDAQADVKEEKLSFKQSAKYFFKNKYIILLVVIILASYMANVVFGTAATYYFKYYVGDLTMQSLVATVSILGYLFLPLLPVIEKRVSHRTIMIGSFIMMIVGGFGKYLGGTNLLVLIVFGTMFSLGVTILMTTRGLALIDCLSYEKQKFGLETEGIYSAVTGFSDKIANGLSAFAVGIVLEIGHWSAELAVQPDSALSAIQFVYNGLPGLLAVIGLVATLFFTVEKELKQKN